jgi:hypothetical protein
MTRRVRVLTEELEQLKMDAAPRQQQNTELRHQVRALETVETNINSKWGTIVERGLGEAGLGGDRKRPFARGPNPVTMPSPCVLDYVLTIMARRKDILQHVTSVAAQFQAWEQALPARNQVVDLVQVIGDVTVLFLCANVSNAAVHGAKRSGRHQSHHVGS